MTYNILPKPKQITETSGVFNTENRDIAIIGDIDKRIIRKAAQLQKLLCKVDLTAHKLYRNDDSGAKITVGIDSALSNEQYTLDISPSKISISGGDAAGCFYGLVTLTQLINTYKNKLPALQINDYPDFKHRGFYHDATRGRVPSVDGVKKIVDTLAALKVNSLQLYVEHTFDFAEFKNFGRTESDYLTAQDILEIDRYCYDNFIDFIPSLSTFGHLYELLQNDKYNEEHHHLLWILNKYHNCSCKASDKCTEHRDKGKYSYYYAHCKSVRNLEYGHCYKKHKSEYAGLKALTRYKD